MIWNEKPRAKFFIVGKGPRASLKTLANKDNRIVVTGRVKDVRPLIDKAKLFVVPIRVGGGTRLKILEAMSMNKAVVSTTLGAEGIHYTNRNNIIITDHPQDFAKAVLYLLNNKEKALEIGAAGRKLVCEQYDWRIIGEKLKKTYQDVLDAKKG
jgi:glycosyltransferase involved in cell wall biosynthesis